MNRIVPFARGVFWVLACLLGLALASANPAFAASPMNQKSAADAAIRQKCINCHGPADEPGIYVEWKKSSHAANNVDCSDCHKAKEGEKAAFKHNGAIIQVIVTPKTCANCHATEVAQQQRSHHAKAGNILASVNNLLAEGIGGPATVNAGCKQCHGSTVEIYNESKHGILYRAKIDEMNLNAKSWVAGVDYTAAPTCATCHVGAAKDQKATHDVGERISWTLRPAVSTKIKWTWFEIWHHEGRRARHGASMNWPDSTWWHGIYEVSQHTYVKWIPERKEVVRQKDGNEAFANAMLDKYFKPVAGHNWFFNGMGKEQIEKARKGYEERYGKGSMK